MAKVIKSKEELPKNVVDLGVFRGSKEYIMAMAGLVEQMYANMVFVSPAHVFVLFEDLPDSQRSQTTHEADTGQICPSCEGRGWNIPFGSISPTGCTRCNETGHI